MITWLLIISSLIILVIYAFETRFLVELCCGIFPKITIKIASFSLVLIGLIFGIHSDILSSHDKYNIHHNKPYDWFNINDILKFPVDQYAINSKEGKIPISLIDSDSLYPDRNQTRKILIVLDKTVSTEVDKNKTDKNHLKLQNYLEENITFYKGYDYKSLEITDLMLLVALNKIHDSSIKTEVHLLFYYGTASDELKTAKSSFYTIGDGKSETLKGLFDSCIAGMNIVNKIDRRNKNTDYFNLVGRLNNRCFTDKDSMSLKNLSLVIISDFEHEEKAGHPFSSLGDKFKELSSKINQINLVKLKGKNKNPHWSDRTIALFKKHFNHLYFYEFETNFLENASYKGSTVNTVEEIWRMFSFAFDATTENPIIFYYSWDKQEYKYDYKCSLKLNSELVEKKMFTGYGFARQPMQNDESSYLMYDNYHKMLHPFEYVNDLFTNESSSDGIKISFVTNKRNSKDYFFEIHNTELGHIARIPIVLKPVLPTSACVFLVFLYLLMGISFSFLIGFILLKMYSHISAKVKGKRIFKFFLLIISFTVIFENIVLIKNIVNFVNYGFSLWNILFFSLMIIWFYVFLFMHFAFESNRLKRLQ